MVLDGVAVGAIFGGVLTLLLNVLGVIALSRSADGASLASS